ncbi:MAG: PAS domain S-box protein [bacterium]
MSDNLIKILMVEDSSADVELTAWILKKEGFNFIYTVVDDKDSFIDALNNYSPDLILCDYSLPSFDGMSALKIANSLYPAIPFIILTGSINEETAVQCMKAGATDYIIKQYQTRLPIAIKGALEQSRLIKEKETAEKKLIESEKKFRLLSENAEDLIYRFILHPTACFEYLSPSTEKITGYSVQEFYNDLSLSLDLLDIDESDITNNKLIALNFKTEFTSKWQKKDGSEIWIEFRNVLLYDTNNEPTVIEGIARDITKAVQFQETLKESEESYRLMFYSNPHPMWVYDLSSLAFLDVNDTAIDTYGYSREEFLSMTLKDIRPQEEVARLMHNIQTTFETVQNSDYWRHSKKDGTIIFVDIASHFINYKGINARLVLVTDVTQRVIAEQKLKEAKEKAEKANKIKTTFLAQMSHEIRTPISIIMNYLGLIKETIKINTEDKDLLDIAFDSIGLANLRIIRTIDLILNMAELQVGAYEPIKRNLDIYDDILVKLIQEYQFEINNKRLNFINKLYTTDFFVYADDYSTSQIFSNLLDNAIKYTKNGTIELLIERSKENKLTVALSDTGIGISEEYLVDLFSPFSQEDQGYSRRYEGNGLGLALVKKYCEINNATISVESKKNIGTKFTVTFL